MKKFSLLFFILLLVGGCAEKDEIESLTTNYEKQLEEQQKEIKKLKEEIEEQQFVPDEDYRGSLSETDRESRRIMQLISEGKFSELKREYDIEFEVQDGKIDFGVPESNAQFPIEWASNFMYIANFIIQPDGMDISYFIDNPTNDRLELIHMSFDKDMQFKFIFVGDA